jgi:Zn-dependent protease
MSSLSFGELFEGECRCGGDMVVVEEEISKEFKELLGIIYRNFEVLDFKGTERELEVEVESEELKRSFLSVYNELKIRGYIAALRRGKNKAIKLLVIKFPPPKAERPWINVILLVITACTTLWAGLYIFKNPISAFVLSSSLLAILGAHEAGHRLAAKRNDIEISNPYFIPAPPILGTFGAVITIKRPIKTKEAMMQMGFLGPVLGFLLALLCTIFGLFSSTETGVTLPALPAFLLVLTRNPSMQLNPLLFSGCVMMMVTALNLLPAGQLDGGHIFRGLLDAGKHYKLTQTVGFSLLLIGLVPVFITGSSISYLSVWGILILLLFSRPHPGALDDVSSVPQRYRLLAAISIIILILCMPLPTQL